MTETIDEQFEIIQKIGSGGQGEVLLVKNSLDNKEYALKKLEKNSEEAYRRFKQEIKILTGINSPHIVKIISENISNENSKEDFKYYVMEKAKFGTIYDNDYYVKDLNLCLDLFKKICLGVKAIHDQSILHRDLKPSNILLVNNQRDVKISDFGLAYELAKKDENITEIREKVGAIYFCAPEQTSLPPQPTKKSDIYSLGKILFFMITGQKSKNPEETLSIKDFISDKNADKVNALINKMCAYEPKNRFGDIGEIIKEVDGLLGNPSQNSTFSLTVLQYRILKLIRSFGYDSVEFGKIYETIKPFYNVTGSNPVLESAINMMGYGYIPRSEFIKMLEESLEKLEKNGIIEFTKGKYKYIQNGDNESLFHQYF